MSDEIKVIDLDGPCPPPPGKTEVSINTEEELKKLTPEEWQALQEMARYKIENQKKAFKIPELPITEEDEDRFFDALASGEPYAETFSKAKGKLVMKFRAKTAAEVNVIYAQLRKDAESGLVREEVDYVTRLNQYNLLIQLCELNGIDQGRVVPKNSVDFDLKKAYENSLFYGMSEDRIYIFLSCLTQFDNKKRRMCQKLIGGGPEGNFP